MKMQTMTVEPEAVITATDFDRLRHLLDTHRQSDATLRRELQRRTVVAPTQVDRDVVTMHSQVRVRDLRLDETDVYTLVYPDEADLESGRVSVLAPIGTALLGARVGQVVRFEAPSGTRRLRVEQILYQPEAAGDYHL